MAFDDKTRNRLQKFVDESRDLLAGEFARQLQYEYGMDPDSGQISSLDALAHLDDHRRETARLLRDTLAHYQSTSPTSETSELIKRIVREQAFTILNRFCAIRIAEARGFSIECIGNGFNSQGFQLYSRLAGTALGETGDAYRCFLYSVFDEFASDLPILFDRYSPKGRLFPKESVLLELLAKINHSDLLPLWSEDETIGWIYQYFNVESERRAMREHGAPRNSRELAVRNQFFTPRYVVEFLTDNTLGRIWYEMRKGQTRLVDECQYMVLRKNAVFLDKGQDAPKPSDSALSEDSGKLDNETEYIRFSARKDPRDLRILDPACGSGHFLLYAFDLLETIYEESWDDSEAPPFGETNGSLRDDYPTVEELKAAMPGLILRCNLNGVDIDPRASQIAALALWLRAQRSYQRLGLEGASRPQITRSNIVTAEPMPGEEDILEEFCSGIRLKTVANIVREIFERMKRAGVAGSLLKIEEDIRELIEQAQEERRAEIERAKDRKGNDLLFTQAAMDEMAGEKQQRLFDSTDKTDEEFWSEAERLVIDSLRDYSEKAVNGRAASRKLFADDAERGFAFIDLFQKPYDVVLMNPPFGEASGETHSYLETHYPSWNDNILCAFIQRAWEITDPNGAVGAIYDRTAVVKSTYESFRREILLPDSRFAAMADLGWGVLDANVEVTTSVLRHRFRGPGVFVDARPHATDLKSEKIRGALRDLASGNISDALVLEKTTSFLRLPNAVIGYDFPAFLRHAFADSDSLQDAGYKAHQGFALKSDKHFRVWWELAPNSSLVINRLFNGATFSPYITPLYDVAVSAVEPEDLPFDSSTRKSGMGNHRHTGVCFGKRGDYFCVHVLPKGHIFTVEGQSIPIGSQDAALDLLAVLNTPLVRASLNKYCGQHKYSGYVNLFPYKPLRSPDATRVLVRSVLDAYIAAAQYDEIQSHFCSINNAGSLYDIGKNLLAAIDAARTASEQCESHCHREVMAIYGVSSDEEHALDDFRKTEPKAESPIDDAEDSKTCNWLAAHSILSYSVGCVFGRWDIRRTASPVQPSTSPDPFAPLSICPPGMLQNVQGMPAEANDVPADYPVSISWPGIIVDDKDHPDDIEKRLREVTDIIWGKRRDDIEQEACDILGCKSLRDYFQKPSGFFADHLKRYSKSRRQAPIYWPLSTESGSYTLWIYCHRLTNQTLYSCINDFVEIKQKQVSEDLGKLRNKSSRNAGEEKDLERLSSLDSELKDFRNELLRVAAFWKPDLNDGVQITAAPLWQLFRFPKWRNALKETWEKLERGEYDWAHLALEIWPDRVRRKCRHDKSLAVAHGLEELYEEPPTEQKKRGRSKKTKSEGEE